MDFCFVLIVIELFLSWVNGQDLLDNIHVSDKNPRELNDFLRSVLKHKRVFKHIRSQLAQLNDGPMNENSYLHTDGFNAKRYAQSASGYAPHENYNRISRHIVHGRHKKKYYSRFKRSSSQEGHKYRNVQIEPMSETGVLIDKADYEAQQNENKVLRIRSVGTKETKHEAPENNNATTTKPSPTSAVNATTNTTDNLYVAGTVSTTPAPEFYFTVDHDILGLQQDVQTEWQNETLQSMQITTVRTKPKLKPKPKKKDDIFADTLSADTLSFDAIDSGHLVAKRDSQASEIDVRSDVPTEEHYIVPIYENGNLKVKPHLLEAPRNGEQRHTVEIYEEPVPDVMMVYPNVADVENSDTNRLISDKEDERSTPMDDYPENKQQTQESTYKSHKKPNKKTNSNHDKPEMTGYDTKDVENAANHKSASLAENDGATTEKLSTTETTTHHPKLLVDSSLYGKIINKPTKDKFNIVDKKEKDDSMEKTNHAMHNFKVIEIEDNTETTQPTTLFTDGLAQRLTQKNYPLYQSTRNELSNDYATTPRSNVSRPTHAERQQQSSAAYKRQTDSLPYNQMPNRLEDQTAPTSAIEQAELGRTPYVSSANATLPPSSYTETTHDTFTVRSTHFVDEAFQVKEAKDMIHIRSDQLHNLIKGGARRPIDEKNDLSDDYVDDNATDVAALEETVDQVREILDQDMKARDVSSQDEEERFDESAGLLAAAGDADVEDEMEGIGESALGSDRYRRVGRRLRSLDLADVVKESDDYLLRSNISGRSSMPDYDGNLDANSLDRNPFLQVAREKTKRNLNRHFAADVDTSPFVRSDELVGGYDEDVDPSLADKLDNGITKKVMPAADENPLLLAHSADSVEGQDRLDKLARYDSRALEHNPRNIPNVMFNEYGRVSNENPLVAVDERTLAEKEGKSSDSVNESEIKSAGQRERPTMQKYLFPSESGERNEQAISRQQAPSSFDSASIKPKESEDEDDNRNRIGAPALIIHIIRTQNQNGLRRYDGEESGHGHRHPPHNKIPPANESEREARDSDVDAMLTASEGPSIVETVVDPLRWKMRKANVNKRNKLATLMDRRHSQFEPEMSVPLSLTTNVANKEERDEKARTARKDVARHLFDSVESFEDVVESKETKGRKERGLLSEDEPDLSEEAASNGNVTRVKRGADLYDANGTNQSKRPLWTHANDARKVLKRYDADERQQLEKRKATHKKKAKKMKKARRMRKKHRRKNKPKLTDCMTKHHKIKKPPDDIGQIRDVLTGHVAKQIISEIQNRLKKKDRLYIQFGQFIMTEEAQKEVQNVDKYRRAQARIEIRHNQMMLHEIIEGLNDIVLAQIHHRLCQHPPPEIKDFLNKITQKSAKRFNLAEGLPLPQATGDLDHQPVDLEDGKFLFPDMQDTELRDEADIKKKAQMIKHLLDKYDRMSNRCKIKVEAVRNYLVDHYNMLHALIERKKQENEQTSVEAEPLEASTQEPLPALANVQTRNDMNPNNLNPANLNAPTDLAGSGGLVGDAAALNGLTSNINAEVKALINKNGEQLLTGGDLQSTSGGGGVGVEGPLASQSLRKRRGFYFSPSELNKFIEDAKKKQQAEETASETKGEVGTKAILKKRFTRNSDWDVSDKYKRLIATAAKIRLKRKTEEKLGKLYGDKLNKRTNSNSNNNEDNRVDVRDYPSIGFESPIVYSLDH